MRFAAVSGGQARDVPLAFVVAPHADWRFPAARFAGPRDAAGTMDFEGGRNDIS